jgi:hypothetical protein
VAAASSMSVSITSSARPTITNSSVFACTGIRSTSSSTSALAYKAMHRRSPLKLPVSDNAPNGMHRRLFLRFCTRHRSLLRIRLNVTS